MLSTTEILNKDFFKKLLFGAHKNRRQAELDSNTEVITLL